MKKKVFMGLLLSALLLPVAAQAKLKVVCTYPYIGDLARTIGTALGLDGDRIQGLRMAGSIHDIGKLKVPAEILVKPGRLTSIEFGLVKQHPQTAFEVLSPVEFPWPLAQIVLQHHERLDGSGYPQGLSGDDILPEAQILAVADVVEAMSSYRPYRPALGVEAALKEVSDGSGTRYYPEVVTACLRVFKEKGFTFSG